jgi:hypothetical protein
MVRKSSDLSEIFVSQTSARRSIQFKILYLQDNLLKAVTFDSYTSNTNPASYDDVIEFSQIYQELSLSYKVLFKTWMLFSLLPELKQVSKLYFIDSQEHYLDSQTYYLNQFCMY